MSTYAQPKDVGDPAECVFYHVADLPGHGTTSGQWDLRATADAYLGNVDFAGKRVLELGTASGFLCFHMEKKGAEVVAYDLSPEDQWDLVLSFDEDPEAAIELNRNCIRRLNNSFWFSHKKMGSRARLCLGSIYNIPEDLGQFDIVTFASILLHLRDPLGAIQGALKFVRDKIIIVELVPDFQGPFAKFMPSPERRTPHGGWLWWLLSPDLLVSFLRLVGFRNIEVTRSSHMCARENRMRELYTIVASR